MSLFDDNGNLKASRWFLLCGLVTTIVTSQIPGFGWGWAILLGLGMTYAWLKAAQVWYRDDDGESPRFPRR